jgi:hypothetical protein
LKVFSIIKINIIFIAVLLSIFLFVSYASADEPEPLTHESPSLYEETTSPSPVPSASTSTSASPSSTSSLEAMSTSGTQLQTINTSSWPSLKDALDPNSKGGGTTAWIFTIWNVCLGLVNIVVAGILIFLAFVNILRIQIDTYALKKILPTLIIAVVLANFSMLICRMIVDFSDALTKTFAADPEQLAKDLQNSMGLVSAKTGVGIVGAAIIAVFISPAVTLIGLVIAFILGVIPGIGILILAFLLFIRTGVIYALVAASPLAFICMALPATQGLFRQWWGQFARWVFMAPVVFFLLKIASMVSSTKFSIWTYIISLGMLYLAIQVPFKLGGAVMAVWGGLGKRLGGAGLRHGLRTADVKFGESMKKLTGKEISPFGVYEGWKRGAELDWQKHLAASTGAGMEIREGVRGMPARTIGAAREAWQTKSLGKLGEVWAPSLSAQVATQEAELKPHLDKARQLQFLDENALDKAFTSAVKDKNESEARSIVLAKSMKGTIKDGDFENYSKTFDNIAKKTNGAEVSAITYALISQAANVSKGTINPIINPYELDPKRRRGTPGNFEDTTRKMQKGLTDEFDEFNKHSDIGKMTGMVKRSLGFVENISRADYKPDNEAHLRFLREVIKNQPAFMSKLPPELNTNITAEVNARPELKLRFNQGMFDIPADSINGLQAKQITEEVRNSLSNLMYNPINLNVPIGAKAEYVLANIDQKTGKIKNNIRSAVETGRKNLQNEINSSELIKNSGIDIKGKTNVQILNELKAKVTTKEDIESVKNMTDKESILQRMEKGIEDIHDITGKSKVNGIKDLIKKFKKTGGA